eukprot:3744574-Amphidinium_carterae.1
MSKDSLSPNRPGSCWVWARLVSCGADRCCIRVLWQPARPVMRYLVGIAGNVTFLAVPDDRDCCAISSC